MDFTSLRHLKEDKKQEESASVRSLIPESAIKEHIQRPSQRLESDPGPSALPTKPIILIPNKDLYQQFNIDNTVIWLL